MKNLLKRLVRDESGVTAIEYGILAAGIVVASVAIISSVGTNLHNTFNTVANSL